MQPIITQANLFDATSLEHLASLLNALDNGDSKFEDERHFLWPLPVFGGEGPDWLDLSMAAIYAWSETHFLIDSHKTDGAPREPRTRFRLLLRADLRRNRVAMPKWGEAPALPPAPQPPLQTITLPTPASTLEQIGHMVEWANYAHRQIQQSLPFPPEASVLLFDLHALAVDLQRSSTALVDVLGPIVKLPSADTTPRPADAEADKPAQQPNHLRLLH